MSVSITCSQASFTEIFNGRFNTRPSAPSSLCWIIRMTVRAKFGSSRRDEAIWIFLTTESDQRPEIDRIPSLSKRKPGAALEVRAGAENDTGHDRHVRHAGDADHARFE